MDRKRGRRKKRREEVDTRRGEKQVYTMDRKRERRDGEGALAVKEGRQAGQEG